MSCYERSPKNVGQINKVAETRKTVEESVGRKKRKSEPSEKQKAKDEKRSDTTQRFKNKNRLQLLFEQSQFTYFNLIISSKSQQKYSLNTNLAAKICILARFLPKYISPYPLYVVRNRINHHSSIIQSNYKVLKL